MNQAVSSNRKRLVQIGVVLATIVLIGIAIWKRDALQQAWADHRQTRPKGSVVEPGAHDPLAKKPLFELVPNKADTLRLVDRDFSQLGINVYTIGEAPPPKTLRQRPPASLPSHSQMPSALKRWWLWLAHRPSTTALLWAPPTPTTSAPWAPRPSC